LKEPPIILLEVGKEGPTKEDRFDIARALLVKPDAVPAVSNSVRAAAELDRIVMVQQQEIEYL
jgi:hypothetical protein